MPLDPKTLWKKAAAKAALTQGNMISGAVAVAASAIVGNPLPLILWGIGSAGWVSLASTSPRYQKLVMMEEKQSVDAQTQAERAAVLQKMQFLLAEQPVVGWVRRGLLPDYLQVYRRLTEVRERVARVLSERTEMDSGTRDGILQQLDYMLGAFLQFVRERVGYLQILTNVRPGGGEESAGEGTAALPQTPPPLPMPVAPVPNRFQRSVRGQAVRPPDEPAAATPPNIDQRLAEIDGKVQRLKALAEKEPATARTREWHIGILEKQRDLLLDCQKRDQCVVAQLGAFADVFEVILGRVSAAQLSATEIASYMGNVVEQVEETERFVASLRPAVDQLMGGVDADLARWPAST